MAAAVRGGAIYCEAVLPPEDVYFEGSEDEDYENAAERRKRYEAAGQKFLSGSVPFLLSATLKGPFDEASGWVNPWRSKNRTAHAQPRLDSANLAPQCVSPARPTTSVSATETQAIEVLKSAECTLPSPESLKQAPFTATPSRLRGKVADENAWEDDMASLTPTKDDADPWVASSPSRKLRKKRSKPSIGINSASKKRRKSHSAELDISTPTTPGRRAAKSSDNEQRSNTKADMRNASIYAHIRELTSKLPRQDLSSDDEIVFDDDDSEAFITSQSVASSSTHLPLSPWRDSQNDALRQRLISSSSFSSPPRRSRLFGELSPVSMSSTQTPVKRAVPPASSPCRLPPMNGFSPSWTSTRTLRVSDLDMCDVDGADGDGADDITMVPETQSQDQELPSPKPLDVNDVNHVEGTPDPISGAAPASRFVCGERTSASDEAATSRNAQDDSVRSLKANHEKLNGHVKPMRATPPRQVTHPIIYDDAEGVARSPRGSNIATLSSSQPAASQKEVGKSPRDPRLSKSTKFQNSSALQSLSPRNGRINSRPALKKAVRSYMSSPLKSSSHKSSPLKPSTSSANRAHSQEDSHQSKENVETKEANESSSPLTRHINIPTSQPSLEEVLATSTPEANPSKVDEVQEDHVASDAATAALSTASPSSLTPPQATQLAETDDAVQVDGPSSTAESAEAIFTQEESSTPPQPSMPLEAANPGTPEMQASGDTSEEPVSESTGRVTDGGALAQEQKQTVDPTDSSQSLVLPPHSIETHQPPSEDMPPPFTETSKRPSTPEPQFAFTSFSSFMSPSPSHRRQARYPWDGIPNGIGPTSRGILISGKKGASGSTASKKRVSWAPLPHEETASTGEEMSSEMNTSSSPSRGRDRAVSPPPPPSTGLASDSLEDRDMRFSHHFAAVADRTKATQLQSGPTASGDGSCDPDAEPQVAVAVAGWTEVTNSPKALSEEVYKEGAKSTGGWDGGEEPTDIVEDIFNEMDDFLQIWDVDAELREARKADKARTAGEKKQDEPLLEVGMGMDVNTDMASQFFF